MDRTTDLETALNFVIRRIEEQAKTSGHPLDDKEHLLIKTLPSSNPHYRFAPELGPPDLVPRNINLERLCALAKAAYGNDRKINPESLDWEFAFAVFTVNRHPMWGVLHSAGVKTYPRPLSDQFFVIIAALFPLIAVILIALNGASLFQSAAILCGSVATMLFIYFASRRIEQRQLEKHIESCRLACRNIGWKSS